MKFNLFLAVLALTLSVNALATNLYCGSKTQGVRYFNVALTAEGATLSVKEAACHMAQIPYKPRSDKYKGWIRVAPSAGSCDKFGRAVTNISAVTFLSLSPEVVRGEQGFAQLGFVNTVDPGAGAELKADLRCFVKN